MNLSGRGGGGPSAVFLLCVPDRPVVGPVVVLPGEGVVLLPVHPDDGRLDAQREEAHRPDEVPELPK